MAKNYDRIKVLMAYYKEFGTLSNIYQDQEYVYNGEVIKIGWIVSNLRQDKKKGLISKDTVDLLDYMDMNWDGKHLFDYYKKYIVAWFLQYKTLSNLTQYSKFQYGDQLIDMGYILTYLKGAKKKGELTKAQIDFLDLCGIV